MPKVSVTERMPTDICRFLERGPSTAMEISKYLSSNGYRESASLGRTTRMLVVLEAEGKVNRGEPVTKPLIWMLADGNSEEHRREDE